MKSVRPGIAAAIVLALALMYTAISVVAEETAGPASAKTSAPATLAVAKPSPRPDQETITAAAVKILRHIAQARGLLNGDSTDTAGAIDELKQADKLFDTINQALPTSKIKDRIWIATKHLEYEPAQAVMQDLPPIYASLSEVVDYLPTEKARQHLDKAKAALQQGGKAEAMAQLKTADASLVYVEAELPMKSARRLVHDAWQALQRDDIKQANASLSDAEDNVAFISMAFQSPLVQAKADIARAGDDYQLGNHAAAAGDLAAAISDLRKATASADRVTRKAATVLVEQLNGVEKKLQADDRGIADRISAAWHRIEALSERAAERVSTAWDRDGDNTEVKQDLIEAKLQLAYARIDHGLMHDNDATKVDLSESDSYLSAARTQANIGVEQQLQAMSLQLAALETSLDKTGVADNSAAYYALESEMTHMIGTL